MSFTPMTTLMMYSIDELIQKLTEKGKSTDATVQAAFELRSLRAKMGKMQKEIDDLSIRNRNIIRNSWMNKRE